MQFENWSSAKAPMSIDARAVARAAGSNGAAESVIYSDGTLYVRGVKQADLVAALAGFDHQASNRRALLVEVASVRWQRQSAGIEINGVRIRTDDETRAALAGAVTVAQLQPTFKTQWKFADGSFAELDAAKLKAMTLAVAAHVSACFAWEKSVQDAIHAGTITDISGISTHTA